MAASNRGRLYASGAFGVLATMCVLPAASAGDGIAPPGTANAAALKVGDLLAVSETGAEAARGGGEASAGVVVVGGNPILGTGGRQQGTGHQDGALVDTGATPVGRVAVAPWEATVTDDGTTRTAHGRASALDLYVLDADTLSASVLTSESTATHTDGRSGGRATSDGAHVNALDGTVDLTVLHAESSSEHGGSAYLVGLNGTEIGSDEQLGAACGLDVAVAAVGCLSTGGGTGENGATTHSGDLLTATVPAAPAVDTTVLGTGTSSGTGTPTAVSGGGGTNDGDDAGNDAGAGRTARGTSRLPLTGGPLAPLTAVAAVAVAAGGWLRAFGRTRPAPTA